MKFTTLSKRIVQPVSVEDIPYYKRILNTSITVDCFDLPLKDCTHYFLSHFHADHYTKLKKSFGFPVYCSTTTAELVKKLIGCNAVGLEMYQNYDMGTFVVRLIEANHCPGSVVLLFLINKEFILHTGDFRYSRRYHLFDFDFRCIYLDNTYENFQNFQSQRAVINKILHKFDQRGKLCPMNICVLCCTYRIGKEKIFLCIAEYLNQMVQVSQDKMKIFRCFSQYTIDKINKDILEIVDERKRTEMDYGFIRKPSPYSTPTKIKSEKAICRRRKSVASKIVDVPIPSIVAHLNDQIETLESVQNPDKIGLSIETSGIEVSSFSAYQKDENALPSQKSLLLPFDRLTSEEAPIKIISMMDLNKLNDIILNICADKIIVLVGSGWKEKEEFRDYKRFDGKTIKKGIEIVYFRYSEHSSSEELKEFKENVKSQFIVNTVKNR